MKSNQKRSSKNNNKINKLNERYNKIYMFSSVKANTCDKNTFHSIEC